MAGYINIEDFKEDLALFKDAQQRVKAVFQKYWNGLDEMLAFALEMERNIKTTESIDSNARKATLDMLASAIREVYNIRSGGRGPHTITIDTLQRASDDVDDAYYIAETKWRPSTASIRRYGYRYRQNRKY